MNMEKTNALYRESTLLLLETNIDDMNPELFPPLLKELLDQGAKDSWICPIVMKHGRPAVLLSVLCEESKRDALSERIFRETTTLGIRVQRIERLELSRELLPVETNYGQVQMKLGKDLRGELLNASPEFRDCERLGREKGVPRKEIYRAAEAAFRIRKDETKA